MKYRTALNIIASLAVILILSLGFAAFAHADDVELKATVSSITEALDKNGNPYVRFIVDEAKSLNGIEYMAGTPVMAFRDMTKNVKEIKVGNVLHVIAAKRSYQGRISYTILKVIE
ncbi:MAG TPA: hypothetical protein ENI23_16350 [bacterium]|nr:hypothetical protein [bacterium]